VLDNYYVTRYTVIRNMTDPSLLVLSSLADGEKHGYAMMDDIEAFAGVRLGPGTLYGAITRLEERGWIRPVDSEDRRRPYRLTPAGRRYLQEELEALNRVVKVGLRRVKPA
jgi:DNA-binding PadR family transcriptional regulator